jgi:serine/threonine-protein kinase PpkA
VSATVLLKSVDIKIPGYRILRPLGEGGMASVFLAVQESLDREVALKVMAPALSANSEFTDRFLKEGQITAKLNHPNLVTVFDIGSHGSVYYLAAEFIPGGTLRERIDAGLSVAETLDIACDIARGLHFAHQKGFVHRDVKPGNVLFKADGTAVLADFGIAKAMDSKSSQTMAGSSIGTPDYMSPEQARAEKVDGRSDLYSLGAVLYEMLTGEAPYQASDPFTVALMHVTQPLPQLPPETAWLQPLVEGLMAKSADNRVPTGEAFVAAVEQLLAASPQAASIQQARASRRRTQGGRLSGSTTRTVQIVRRLGLPSWAVSAAAGVLLLAVGVGTWTWISRSDQVDVLPVQANASTSRPDSATLPPEVVIPRTAEERFGDIESLLAQADAYRDYGTTSVSDPGRKLTSPPGENAVDLYRQVLALDPANARANAGLKQIGEFYLQSGQKLCERQIWGGCRAVVIDGMKAAPDHAGLKTLLAQAEKQLLGG